jgi:hypothetical protein
VTSPAVTQTPLSFNGNRSQSTSASVLSTAAQSPPPITPSLPDPPFFSLAEPLDAKKKGKREEKRRREKKKGKREEKKKKERGKRERKRRREKERKRDIRGLRD